MKSFCPRPSTPGDLGPSRLDPDGLVGVSTPLPWLPAAPFPSADDEDALVAYWAPSGLTLGTRAGLWGRLVGQNWRSSLPSSWPVVDQLERMLSRSSCTCRLMSSSFFFSHDTLSSWRDVPRLSCRDMYFS